LFAFLLFCIVFKVQCSSAPPQASRASLFILSPAQRIVNTFFQLFSLFFDSFGIVEQSSSPRPFGSHQIPNIPEPYIVRRSKAVRPVNRSASKYKTAPGLAVILAKPGAASCAPTKSFYYISVSSAQPAYRAGWSDHY